MSGEIAVRDKRRFDFNIIDHEVIDIVQRPAGDGHAPGANGYLIYSILLREARGGGECKLRRSRIAQLSGLSPRTISSTLQRLVDVGLIEVEYTVDDYGATDASIYKIVEVEKERLRLQNLQGGLAKSARGDMQNLQGGLANSATHNVEDVLVDILEDTPLSPPEGGEQAELALIEPPEGAGKGRTEYPEEFEEFWRSYPADGRADKRKAFRAWVALMKLPARERPSPEQLIAAARHYSQGLGITGYQAKGAQAFLSARARPYEEYIDGLPEWVIAAEKRRGGDVRYSGNSANRGGVQGNRGGADSRGRHLPEMPREDFRAAGEIAL